MNPLKLAFASHGRRWRDFVYVYPVIARRSRGLSIGVNLNPDAACNFDCVYCSVDRSTPRTIRKVDLAVLERELKHLVENRNELFDEPEFRDIPPDFRRLNDIAFSGDGEPTAVPVFPATVQLVADVRRAYGLDEVKLVVITDACYLTRPAVADALAVLDKNNGEIWAKLDAGTEEYFRRVNRGNYPLQHVLDNILATARVRPIVLQSLFMCLDREPPPASEIDAYVERVRTLVQEGAQIALVQVYTVARRTAEAYVAPESAEALERIAGRLRGLGLTAAVFP